CGAIRCVHVAVQHVGTAGDLAADALDRRRPSGRLPARGGVRPRGRPAPRGGADRAGGAVGRAAPARARLNRTRTFGTAVLVAILLGLATPATAGNPVAA